MSMVTILLAVLLLGGIAVAVRLVSEHAARQRAETRTLELRQQNQELHELLARAGQHEREWLAVLAHEMRSPVGAILGYGELIGDGTLTPEHAADAALRMSRAAEQVLGLIRGMEYVALINGNDADDPETVDAGDLVRDAAGVLAYEAEARNAALELDGGHALLVTRREQAALALLLALGAAVKVSGGRTLRLAVRQRQGGGCVVTIIGTALSPDTDDPAEQPMDRHLSGSGLRIALARSVAGAAGGTVELSPDGDASTIAISLPDMPARDPG